MVVFVLLLLFFRFIHNLCFFILSIGQVRQFLNNQIHFQRWMLLNTFLQFSVNFFFLYYVSVFGSLNYIIFRDSKIAKKFKCARTKTSSVLNEAITPSLRMYLVDQLSKEPYALVNDCSSDSVLKKWMLYVLWYFTWEDSKRSSSGFTFVLPLVTAVQLKRPSLNQLILS